VFALSSHQKNSTAKTFFLGIKINFCDLQNKKNPSHRQNGKEMVEFERVFLFNLLEN